MLEAHDLAARRGNAHLFSGLGFRVNAGEALVVTGANGRGKTTLLRVLCGLSHPESGEVRLDGVRMAPGSPGLRAAVTWCGHAPALKDELSARENLISLATLAGETADRAAIEAALDRVALRTRQTLPARSLSQGQRRRVGLARLALSTRRAWILDEPATALDADGVATLEALVTGHLEAGGLAILSTHAPLALPSARVKPLALPG